MAQDPKYQLPTYTPAARAFHWLIVLLIFIQLPLGFYMAYRGHEMPHVNDKGETVKGLFDALTGFLYNWHKLIGMTVLVLVVLRLVDQREAHLHQPERRRPFHPPHSIPPCLHRSRVRHDPN